MLISCFGELMLPFTYANACASGETKLETKEPENNNSEFLRKIKVIEKGFK